MALDVGDRWIGVAIADESGTIASPVGRVERGTRGGKGRGEGDGSALAEIGRLVAEWEVTRLVVGLPTGLSGREGPQAATVRAFVAAVAGALGPEPPIVFWDERLTTTIAERSLIATGARRDQRRREIDAVAAAVILQSFLDAARSRRLAAEAHAQGQAARSRGG